MPVLVAAYAGGQFWSSRALEYLNFEEEPCGFYVNFNFIVLALNTFDTFTCVQATRLTILLHTQCMSISQLVETPETWSTVSDSYRIGRKCSCYGQDVLPVI